MFSVRPCLHHTRLLGSTSFWSILVFPGSGWFRCHLPRSTGRRALIGTRTSQKIPAVFIVVLINFSHRWSNGSDCLTVLWLWLLLSSNNVFDHFGLHLQSKMVLPKDLRLFPSFSHQGTDPRRLVLVLLGERVDALGHLLRRCASLGNVFLVGLENPRHFSEVVLVFLHLFRQAGERCSHSFVESVMALDMSHNYGH